MVGVWLLGVAALWPPSARATTVGDYLRDGWDLQGFANTTIAQLLLRRQDRALLCTVTTHKVLKCVDISTWQVNEAK